MATELLNTQLYIDHAPRLYYRFEGNGNDTQGNTNLTANTISFASSTGLFTQGAHFNGTTSNFNSANNPLTNAQLVTGSVGGWFRRSANPSGDELLFDDEGWVQVYLTATGAIKVLTDGDTPKFVTSSTTGLGDNNWHLVELTWSSTQDIIFIDAVLDTTNNTPANQPHPDSTTRPLRLGSDQSGTANFFGGDLDDWALWSNYRLVQTDVNQLWTGGVPVAVAGSKALFFSGGL